MKDYIKGSIAGTVLMALWCLYWLYTPSIKEDKPEWPSQKEAYRAWRATNGLFVALPIHSFKDTDTLRLSERGKEVLRINADRTVYTFLNTNCELVCVDTNGVKWKGQWVREFTNDFKWSDHGTNTYPPFSFVNPPITVWLHGPVTYTEQVTNHWVSFITNGLMQWRKTQ